MKAMKQKITAARQRRSSTVLALVTIIFVTAIFLMPLDSLGIFDQTEEKVCAVVAVLAVGFGMLTLQRRLELKRAIMEQERTSELIRKSEERYRTFIDATSDLVFLKDGQSRHLIANNQLVRFFGKNTEAEVLGKTDFELMSADAAQGCRDSDLDALRLGTVLAAEERVGDRIYEARKFPVRIGDNTFGVGGFIRDITERRQAEDELWESEQKLKEAQAIGRIGFWEFDLQSKEITWSDETYKLYGRDPALGPPTVEEEAAYYTPEQCQKLREYARCAIEDGKSSEYDLEAALAGGKQGCFSATMKPIKNEQGHVVRLFGTVQDISERKRLEEALRSSEARHRLLVENVSEAIVVAQDGLLKFVNPKTSELFGYSAEELTSRPFPEFIHPDDREMVVQNYLRRLKGEQFIGVYDFRLMHANGSIKWVEINAVLIAWEGRPATLNFLTDITIRKQKEAALAGSEKRYRELVENMNSCVAVYEPVGDGVDFIFKDFNKAGERIESVSRDAIVGKSVLEVFSGVKDMGLFEVFQRVWKTGEPEQHPVSFYKDERIAGWRENFVYRTPSGEIVAVYDDVTERKRVEEELKDSEERLKTLFDFAPDAYYLCDLEGKLVDANKAAEEMSGQPKEELIGKSYLDSNHLSVEQIPKTAKLLAANALGQPTGPDDFILYGVNGKPRDVEIRTSPVRIKDKMFLLAIVRDITERRQAENLLRAQHNLGIALSETHTLDATLRLCLDSAIDLSGMDCGGIYLVDEDSGNLDLAIQKGLNDDFVESTSHYDANSVNAQLVMAGNPVYGRYQELGTPLSETDHRETLRAIAVVPVCHEDRVVGCLNVASHTFDEVPEFARNAFETIASQIGSAISRSKIDLVLLESQERYRAVVEQTAEGIYLADPETQCIIEANRAFQSLLGYTKEEILSLKIYDIVAHNRDSIDDRVHKLVSGNDPIFGERQYRRKDGSTFDTEVTASMVEVGQKRVLCTIVRNITERKLAENALRESEDKFRSLSEQSPNMIFINRKGQIVYANAKCEEEMGYKREELYSPHFDFLSLIAPESLDLVTNSFSKHLDGENAPPYEYVIVTKGGRRIEALVATKLISYGGETAILGVATDIAERKRAEETVRKSENHFRSVWENSMDGMRLADANGMILSVNQAFCRMVDETKEELEGHRISEIFSDEQEDHILRRYQERFAARTVEPNFEKQNTLRNGRSVWFAVSNSFVDLEGQPPLLLSIFRDVTEQKRAEGLVRILSRAVEQSPASIVITDTTGNIEYVNPKFTELTGYAPEEAIGKNPRVLKSGETPPEEYKRLWDSITSGDEWRGEFHNKKKNGELYWESASISAIKNSDEVITHFLAVKEDITEHKRAEELLRCSEEQYRLITENTQDLIYMVDIEGKLVYVSPSASQLIGERPEVLLGRSFFSLVHPEDEKIVSRTFARALFNGGGRRVEFRERGQNGDWRSFESSWSWIFDAEGNPQNAVIVSRDVTDRKVAQKEINMLASALRSTAECVSITDMQDNILFVNEAFLKTYGYTEDEILGQPITILRSKEHRNEDLSAFLPATLKCGWQEELWNRRKDGTELPVFLSTSAVRDSQGQVVGLIGVATDITKRKEAEGALRKSEERYRSLFEDSKDVVYVGTPDGRFLDVNPAGVQLFGYSSKEELLQVNVKEFYEDSRDRAIYQRTLEKQGFVQDYEVSLKRKDGEKLIVLETATTMRDDQGNIVAYRGIIRDVTKQKELEREVIQAQKMESVGTLAGGIAHDFNNILGIIQGHASLLKRRGDGEEKSKRSIDVIEQSVKRGADLVRQIMTFARKSDVSLGPLDANLLIGEFVKMLSETFPKKIDLSLQLSKDIPLIVADVTQVHQLLLNLCVNSRDAMPGGGTVMISTDRVLGTTIQGHFPFAVENYYVHIAISDTGMGMDEHTRARIFDPFFTTKGIGKGTGLGLAVVWGIMQGHKGLIRVESEVGRGTSVHLYFPVPAHLASLPEKERQDGKEDGGGNETILLVEDEQAILEWVCAVFESKGYKVLTAENGVDAMNLFRQCQSEISVVLTDLGLPRIDGAELFHMMRSINPRVKVILSSGFLEPTAKSELFKAGAKAFLQKPYDPYQALKVVREVIDEK
jgi:PAS domain S-box-containing protein